MYKSNIEERIQDGCIEGSLIKSHLGLIFEPCKNDTGKQV
jgi:hypothetical protein